MTEPAQKEEVEIELIDRKVMVTFHCKSRYDAIVRYEDIIERANKDHNFTLSFELKGKVAT